MENQGPLILDISSDEETGFADVRKSAGCEFIDREDVFWLPSLLFDEGRKIDDDDDSDDVVFVSEVSAKTPKESRSESLKPLPKVVDDDDDCMVLDGDPDKSIVVVTNKVDDDEDDIKIVGEKGEVACRDFPHPRHDCAKHPFASTPHDVHCGQCHCYVCDSLAPCSNWGTGANGIDHCHASDKEEYWKTERKHAKRGDNPKSDTQSKGGARIESFFKTIQMPVCAPAQPNSLPENQALNPVTFRPCLPNAINRGRSQPSGYVAPRYNTRSQLVSVQSHPRNPQSFPPRAVFKRNGFVGASNRFQSPLNRCPSPLKAPVRNCYNGSNQQTVRSQAAVSGTPLLDSSSPHYMDSGIPQMNSQPYSSYGILGSSLPYTYSQPSVGNIKNPTPLPSQTVTSYHSTNSTRSSPGSDFADSGSSKLQEHSCPSSSVSHSKMQHPSSEEIFPRRSVELAAAAECRIPEIGEVGLLDYGFCESWTFENQSFSAAVEASAPAANWNAYSPEPAFADAGILFDI